MKSKRRRRRRRKKKKSRFTSFNPKRIHHRHRLFHLLAFSTARSRKMNPSATSRNRRCPPLKSRRNRRWRRRCVLKNRHSRQRRTSRSRNWRLKCSVWSQHWRQRCIIHQTLSLHRSLRRSSGHNPRSQSWLRLIHDIQDHHQIKLAGYRQTRCQR